MRNSTETFATGDFATGSHDLPPSSALTEFMRDHWAPLGPPTAAGPLPADGFTAARRARLAERIPGRRLVIPAGREKIRSNDMPYRFRPHTAYTYLTGDQTPDGVLVVEPDGESVLYLRPPSPREAEAYRDRVYGEFWVGRRRSLAEAEHALRITVRDLKDLPDALAGGTLTRLISGVDHVVDELLCHHDTRILSPDFELQAVLSELRLIKDPWEIEQLRAAVDITVRGFEDIARALADAARHERGERWIEGVFGHRARLEGNGVGYETIAAAGAHACVLHWTRNDGPLVPGEMLLLDAGAETDELYTADVTRTLPISGTFTPLQRDLYELELRAQTAGIATLRPGACFRDFHQAGMRVIVEGLVDLGIVKTSVEEALSVEDGRYRRYTLCGSGHMLGMDVHDCAQARAETYLDARLEAGHVLTVEPGIYFQPDDLTLPEELRGIGIRLEDDLVITPSGAEMLSGALPRTPDDVEAWLGSLKETRR